MLGPLMRYYEVYGRTKFDTRQTTGVYLAGVWASSKSHACRLAERETRSIKGVAVSAELVMDPLYQPRRYVLQGH